MRIKNRMLCLLTVSLMGNIITLVYTMAKERTLPFDLYSSYVPGEDDPGENAAGTEDAPNYKKVQIKNKPKISARD